MKPGSELFSWSRWTQLVSKHWAENRKPYLLSLLGVAGLLAVWFSFILLMDKSTPMNVIYQYMTYFFGLYITGSLYASTLFAQLGSRRDGIGFLALPASQLEKLVCAILFGVLLIFVAYTVIYYAVDIPLVRVANRLIASAPRNYPNTDIRVPAMRVYNVFTGDYGPGFEKEMHLFLFAFFSVQSAFLLGSVYFSRFPFIKMVVVLAVGFLAMMAIQANLILPLLPSGWHNGWTEWFSRDDAGNIAKIVALPPYAEKTVMVFIQWVPPVLLWIATWYRLKEKQV